MTRNKTWQDLLRSIENVVPRSIFEQLAFDILNASVGRLWDAFPWRQSVAVLPPFYLIPEVFEYPDVLSDMPSDLGAIMAAWFVDLSDPSRPVKFPLQVVRDVEQAGVYGQPHLIARREIWSPTGGLPAACYRLFPTPPMGMGAPHHMITGTYKRIAPQVGPATLSNPLPFSDSYFADLVSIARYTAWEFAGDPRARERETFAALNAIFVSVSSREGFHLGAQTINPGYPLVSLDLR